MTREARYPSLEGRVVFISGGATGIGATLVEAFARQGCHVAFVDIDEANATELVVRIADAGHPKPLFLLCDVTDIDALRNALSNTAAALGTVRVLVNNAADDQRHRVAETTPELWDHAFAVNVRHHFFAAQAVAPGMTAAGGGSIVNMGSISWMTKTTGMPAYTAAKAAVKGLTMCLAREFGPANIRVNSVVPGWVMTERQLRMWVTPEGESTIDSAQCLKARLQASDIAAMVLFLGADDSRLCTAQDFVVDAGWA